jgi:hypothetical protein
LNGEAVRALSVRLRVFVEGDALLFENRRGAAEASIREIAVARAWRSARRVSGDASDEIEVADVPRAASERSERVSMA